MNQEARHKQAAPAASRAPVRRSPKGRRWEPCRAEGVGREAAELPVGILSVALLLSGASALIYQILWVRSLSFLMGNSLDAVSTVLATFMAGLGLGAFLAARWTDRLTGMRLARLYALLEFGIAAFALLFPVLLAGLSPLFRVLHSESPMATVLSRVVVSFLLLSIPTTLMGATLPTLTALRERNADRQNAGRSAGLLYGANSFGAMLGSVAAGLVLVRTLGMVGTNLVAVFLTLLAAALVFGSALGSSDRSPEGERKDRRAGFAGSLALIVIGISGFAALASEVAWTRAIVLLIGPTTYGFSFIVAAVIGGLALGSAAASRRWSARQTPSITLLALMQLGAGLSSLGLIWVVPSLVLPVAELIRGSVDDPNHVLAVEFLWVTALVFLPSFFFGGSFPMAVNAVARSGPALAGKATGRVYASNTFGAVLGSLVAGFVWIPRAGAQNALSFAAALHLLAAGIVFFVRGSRGDNIHLSHSKYRGWGARAVALVLSVVASILAVSPQRLLPAWDPELMSGGLYKYAAYLDPREFIDFLRRGELLHHAEDKTGTISVKRIGTRLSLAIDGKVDATNTEDMLTQRMLAHVPLLVHPKPEDVLVIGLGSGVTAGSALTHPIETLVALEISPEVAEASHLFSDVNHRPFEDPRFELRIGDGRNHLLLTDSLYDVIISEPSNPWMAGVSSLFTVDFFELSRERLAPGGLFCQWAHIYNMSEDDLKTIVASFTDVFEDTALFLLSEGDVLLLGAAEAFSDLQAEKLASRIARQAVRDDLASIDIHGLAGLGTLYTVASPALSEWASNAERHRDARPVLEYRLARSMNADTGRGNRLVLMTLADSVQKDSRFSALFVEPTNDQMLARARSLEQAESLEWAFDTYSEFLSRGGEASRSGAAYRGLVRTSLALPGGGQVAVAEALMKRLADQAAPVEAGLGLALLYRNTGALDAAKQALAVALTEDPEHRDGLFLAAEVAAAADNIQLMAELARRILAKTPLDAEAAALLAEANLRRGNAELSARQSGAILARRPGEVRALQVHAISNAQLGELEKARQAFEALVELEPEAWIHLNNYAQMELESDRFAAARSLFERAVDLNPRNRVGYLGLKRAAELSRDEAALERAESMLSFLKDSPH